jgi:hypothetical protein
MGMHDLTEQEIHEQWTTAHIEVWSEVLGIELAISDWQEDGMVTLSVPAFSAHGMWGFCGAELWGFCGGFFRAPHSPNAKLLSS